jgi:hypothetical protein
VFLEKSFGAKGGWLVAAGYTTSYPHPHSLCG